MSGSWVNWGDFLGVNAQQQQAQAQQQEALAAQQQGVMDKALLSLDASALDQSRSGAFKGMQSLNGYSDLMAQRDAALQQSPARQQAAAWESDMGGPGDFKSPWADLSRRLGGMNQKQAGINTRTQNQQAWDKQQAEIKAYQAAQAKKLDEAMNGKARKEAADYAAWSDHVQNTGSHYGGSPGAGAYYDARDGKGPQPVRQQWGPRVTKMQKNLQANDENQLNPPTTNSNFGQSTSGF